jgi:hypothetical protein
MFEIRRVLRGVKQRLVSLSAANDGLHLARNNHELQKRELSEVNERHEHKLRTLSREADALRERNLQAFLETRQEIIRRRRAESAAQRATEEAAIMKGEAKRLETELSVARSMKLFRDVAELRSALTERDKQLYLLREELQKTKEAQLMQSYTDAHIRSVESENTRLSKQIQTLREELLEAVRLRHAPILETIGVAVGENKVFFWKQICVILKRCCATKRMSCFWLLTEVCGDLLFKVLLTLWFACKEERKSLKRTCEAFFSLTAFSLRQSNFSLEFGFVSVWGGFFVSLFL